jgi:hypothetical protein
MILPGIAFTVEGSAVTKVPKNKLKAQLPG